ncbi:retinol dehydrogenase 12-like [Acropora millepora]|uniref:retinol dehydrogenase 12-like n=1 Tax=Acropora millepora TaxID=45264 RepID=UPI001CF2A6DB|nr:retinol dehydrogenase 12-like [Acropora millepora]
MNSIIFNRICVLVCFTLVLKPSSGADSVKAGDPSSDQTTSTGVKFVVGVAIAISVVALLKLFFGGGVCRSKARLDGKTAIVTGANTGIGKETALDFAKRGAKVILACRDEAKANQAAKDIIAETGSDKLVLVRVVDLSSFESVRAFAKLVNETEERLDILVNNAGLFGSHPSPSKDDYEMIMQVNYVSHFLLTLLLMEKLRKSAPSRIVNVSSMGSTRKDLNLQLNKDYFITLCSSSFQRYAESKLAQVLFTKELSQRLEGSGVTVYSLHPGAVRTEIWRNSPLLHKPLLKQLFGMVTWLTFKDSKQGAQTTIYCSVAKECASESGNYYSDCQTKEHPNKHIIEDPGFRKKLWEISETITGESWKD